MSNGQSFRQRLYGATKTISWIRVTIYTLATICLLQFAAIFLFPDGLPLQIDVGVLADWTAALGTWVVGIAAFELTRLGYVRQKNEAALLLKEKQMARRMRLLLLKQSAEQCNWLKNGFDEEREEKQRLSLPFLHVKLSAATAIYSPIKFDIEGIDLEEQTIRAIGTVKRSLIAVLTTTEMFLEAHPDRSKEFSESKSPRLGWLLTNTEKLATEGESLVAAFDDELKRNLDVHHGPSASP